MLKITDTREVYKSVEVKDFDKKEIAWVTADRLAILGYRFSAADGELEVTLGRYDPSTGQFYQPSTQYLLKGEDLAKLFTPGPSDGKRAYGDFRKLDLYKALLAHKPSNGNRPLSDFTELEDGN